MSPHGTQVTRRLFGVSRLKVYAAKLHAAAHGAAANVPPAVTSYRLKPEAASALNAFANDPSNVQLLADNKGASHEKVALKQVPAKLYKKYDAEVPAVARSDTGVLANTEHFSAWKREFYIPRGRRSQCKEKP